MKIGQHIVLCIGSLMLLTACSSGQYVEQAFNYAKERTDYSVEDGFKVDWVPEFMKQDGYDVDVDTSSLYVEREIKFSSTLSRSSSLRYAPPPPREAYDDYVVPIDAIKQEIAAQNHELASL